MESMRTIELILGSIIVVSTLVDIFQSAVVLRPTRRSLRLAPFLLNGMWPLWKWIALRFPSAKYRAAFLGIYAPLTVVVLLLVWGIALIFGYGLLFLALHGELQPRLNDLGTALYFAGTSLLTLGFGDIVPTGGITRVLALCALLDAATLIMSCIEDGPAGPATLLYHSGCQLANDLKDYFKISPAQSETGTPKRSFEAAYTRLKSAGFCLADPEPAWASFIKLRSAYAQALPSFPN